MEGALVDLLKQIFKNEFVEAIETELYENGIEDFSCDTVGNIITDAMNSKYDFSKCIKQLENIKILNCYPFRYPDDGFYVNGDDVFNCIYSCNDSDCKFYKRLLKYDD